MLSAPLRTFTRYIPLAKSAVFICTRFIPLLNCLASASITLPARSVTAMLPLTFSVSASSSVARPLAGLGYRLIELMLLISATPVVTTVIVLLTVQPRGLVTVTV